MRTQHRPPAEARWLLAASIGFFAFCTSGPLTQIGSYLASAQESSAAALAENDGYDPTQPVALDATQGIYSYHGVAMQVRRGRDGDLVLPTVEEMGLCGREPAACPASGDEEQAPALEYDPNLPVYLDAATSTYWYHGVAMQVRRDRDGEFVLPTVEEMGLCDRAPEAYPTSGDEGQDPAPEFDPTQPIYLDAATGIYWYHGVAVNVRRGRDGDFVLPTAEEMGLAAED